MLAPREDASDGLAVGSSGVRVPDVRGEELEEPAGRAFASSKDKVQTDGTTWSESFTGPLIRAESANQAVSCRVRLDDLLSVTPDAQAAFDELRELIRNWSHRVRYVPHEGGWHERFHDRMWIDRLSSEYDGKYLLGIRPLGNSLMAAVERMNALPS